MELFARVRQWIADDPDENTASELTALLSAADGGESATVGDLARADLLDRFSGLLQFGTAGLRGPLGGGPARMNRAVVSRAAAGIAAFLATALDGEAPVVVIGYDGRHGSQVFALDSAQILAGAGARVHLFDAHCPTPVLAYATKLLNADAGIMVTASHNPPQDNGYKVYLGGRVVKGEGRGAQLVAPYDDDIAARIAAVSSVRVLPRADAYESVGADLVTRYVGQVLTHAPTANPLPGLKIVYTPMHGVGGQIMERVLKGAGFTEVTVVEEQFQPDPDFPTVAFPNPEEDGALDLAIATAEKIGADLIIANDPDADRVSIAIPTHDGWRQLSGDEVGALLGEMMAGTPPPPVTGEHVFANSIVSSRLLGAIAAHHGIAHHETLTGFKWISRTPGLTYGYEEAIGYCTDPQSVRDKDGISAGLMLALLTAEFAARGRTLVDALDDLAVRHGLYASGALSVRMENLADIPAAMARLRAHAPKTLAGGAVVETRDLADATGGLPATDALIYFTDAGDRVIVRPSGTEPKVKCYLEVIAPVEGPHALANARAWAAQRLGELKRDIAAAAGFDR